MTEFVAWSEDDEYYWTMSMCNLVEDLPDTEIEAFFNMLDAFSVIVREINYFND